LQSEVDEWQNSIGERYIFADRLQFENLPATNDIYGYCSYSIRL